MIVIDTSVLANLLIGGPYQTSAQQLADTTDNWIAPDFWMVEFTSVIRKHELAEKITLDDASAICNDAQAMMQEANYAVSMEQTLEVSRKTLCSSYDSQFIALAEALGVTLYTCDKKLVKNAAHVAVLLEKQ